MAVTQQTVDGLRSKVEALNQAIADGVRSVTLGNQTVTYNTADSLIAARDDLQTQLKSALQDLAVQTNPAQRSRVMLLNYGGRGYSLTRGAR